MIRKIMMILRWGIFISILAGGIYLFQNNKCRNTGENVEILFMESDEEADCTILRQGNKVVLIDAGSANNVEQAIKYLKESGIKNIDYLIMTYPMTEEESGLEMILNTFQVEHIIEPIYHKENERLKYLNGQIDKRRIPIIYPTHTRNFTVGGMKLIVYPPLKKSYIKDTDYSLAVLMKHQNVNIVFTGDAEKKRIKELLEIHWPKADILKIPEHGNSNSITVELLKKIQSQNAVVTAAKADDVINNFYQEINGTIFYANESSIIFESNGEYVKLQGE